MNPPGPFWWTIAAFLVKGELRARSGIFARREERP